jgi:hypothetical protein
VDGESIRAICAICHAQHGAHHHVRGRCERQIRALCKPLSFGERIQIDREPMAVFGLVLARHPESTQAPGVAKAHTMVAHCMELMAALDLRTESKGDQR